MVILAAEVRAAGGFVVVGVPNGAPTAGPLGVFARESFGPDVYVAYETVLGPIAITDDLGSQSATPVTVVAATGASFWSTATGEPHPSPPSQPLVSCLVLDHDTDLGSPGLSFAYFLVPYLDGWFMDWRAAVVDGLIDSSETYGGDGVEISEPVPLEALRIEPAM